jgi:hypothetical protein
MSRAFAGHDLEARVEALRRELTALIVTLCNTGQRLEELADELRSRRQMDKVVALDRRRQGSGELGRTSSRCNSLDGLPDRATGVVLAATAAAMSTK